MMECLDRFKRFLHDEKHKLPVLVEAGLIHVQFETIHPFLDGNGRLGHLLITLILCAKGISREPLLWLVPHNGVAPSCFVSNNVTQCVT
jgi:Fic family protein